MLLNPLKGNTMNPKTRNRLNGIASSLFLLAASLTASAQTIPAGRLLASNCFQCHGTNGAGPGFDKLAGKSASEIYKEMIEFRSGKEGNGLMTKHSMGYTDAQLRQLAQWLSTQR
jgi:cytochrome c553